MTYGCYIGIEYKNNFFCLYQSTPYTHITYFIRWVVSNIYQLQYEINNNDFILLNGYKMYTLDDSQGYKNYNTENRLPTNYSSCFIITVDDVEQIKWRDYGFCPIYIYQDWKEYLDDITIFEYSSLSNYLTPEYVNEILPSATYTYSEYINI